MPNTSSPYSPSSMMKRKTISRKTIQPYHSPLNLLKGSCSDIMDKLDVFDCLICIPPTSTRSALEWCLPEVELLMVLEYDKPKPRVTIDYHQYLVRSQGAFFVVSEDQGKNEAIEYWPYAFYEVQYPKKLEEILQEFEKDPSLGRLKLKEI